MFAACQGSRLAGVKLKAFGPLGVFFRGLGFRGLEFRGLGFMGFRVWMKL